MALSPAGFMWILLSLVLIFANITPVLGLVNDRADNLAVYWGQDSGGQQQRLSFYCEDDTIDVIPLAFLYIFFGDHGLPVIDLANICNQWDDQTFSGSKLADCSFLASDIKTCQAKGKVVTLSLGGGTGQVGFKNDGQAISFAESIWDMFLGGDSDIRPFGDAVLDGVDLDIESGSPAHYATFVTKLRSLAQGAHKRYYVTAAPQCPFPDANIGDALNNAIFDAIYVQFYNNFCELSAPSEFNFETWDKWARTTSPNPDIKVYIGAPGSRKAAGEGYVDINTLIQVAQKAQDLYPSFGGVMLWDADEAFSNNRYDLAIKNAIRAESAPEQPPTSSAPRATTRSLSFTAQATRTGGTPNSKSQTQPTTTFRRDPKATARVKFPSLVGRRLRIAQEDQSVPDAEKEKD